MGAARVQEELNALQEKNKDSLRGLEETQVVEKTALESRHDELLWGLSLQILRAQKERLAAMKNLESEQTLVRDQLMEKNRQAEKELKAHFQREEARRVLVKAIRIEGEMLRTVSETEDPELLEMLQPRGEIEARLQKWKAKLAEIKQSVC